jgi:hypothetical protein
MILRLRPLILRYCPPLGVAFALFAGAVPAAATRTLPLDQGITVGGVDVVCTNARGFQRWVNYPVQLAFTGPAGQDSSEATMTLSNPQGRPLMTVRCPASHVLLRLPPGRPYHVFASSPGAGTGAVTVEAPARAGLALYSVHFPQAPSR